MNRTEMPCPGGSALVHLQRSSILRLLRLAGVDGIAEASLIFDFQYTQCAERIEELKRQGYVIRSEDRGGSNPTWYVLESEPLFELVNFDEH
jgi:hypothetical protein